MASMRDIPSPHRLTGHRRGVARTWVRGLLTLLAAVILGTGVTASPYDGTVTRPGTVITNAISMDWGREDFTPPPEDISTSFTVVPFDLPAALDIMGYSPGSDTVPVTDSAYSTESMDGPFTRLAAPHTHDGAVLGYGALPLADVPRVRPGETLFLRLTHPALNFDSGQAETAVLELTDVVTGDHEILRLRETGADTGIFVAHIPTDESAAVVRDGVLSTRAHSRVDARHSTPWRPEAVLTDDVLVGPVDPQGRVFDSRTGALVDGARITLIDTETGAPAVVYGDDLTSRFPATVTTGGSVRDSSGQLYTFAPGEYRFPFIDAGRYRLAIDPPRGLVAPSLVEDSVLQDLDGAPYSLVPASRLDPFEVVPGDDLVIDVPLDGAGLITVTRAGSADSLETGDFIRFTVTARTNSEDDVTARLIDALPPGLRAIPDSLRIDGRVPAQAPTLSEDGRTLSVPGVEIPAGDIARMRYVARVSPAAAAGESLVSSSRATAPRMISNTARHRLEVRAAFDETHDTVVGQVFEGCAEAPPDRDLSGIRIMLSDGRTATTDSLGRFTVRGLDRGSHVLSLDPLSLPPGTVPVACVTSPDTAGSAWSRFVTARGGMLRQSFFHLGTVPVQDIQPEAAPEMIAADDFDADWLSDNAAITGLVFPPPGHLARGRSIDIVAARQFGETLDLRVNGTPVAGVHRRPSITAPDIATQLDVWKGVQIPDGVSTVTLVTRDAAGREIARESREVAYTNSVAHMEILAGSSVLESDGRTRPAVTLRITDADGVPLHPGAIVGVTPPTHTFSVEKTVTDPDTGATRTRRDAVSSVSAQVDADGLLRLRLAPVDRPGPVIVETVGANGPVRAQARIDTPDRPWVLVGLASGTVAGADVLDAMRPLTETERADLGSVALSGRASLFAQGVVRGSSLLTLRYDSAREGEDDSDFFMIDPDSDYVVYGDSSTEGTLAESRGPLYVRLEGPGHDLLYGDFDTGLDQGVASYTRRLTGARALFPGEAVSVMAFAAETSQRVVEERFAADGTSGPFDLSQGDILAASETVLVEVTNRDRPSEILETRRLERGRDYDIDYRRGRLLLADPLPSRTSALDPQALVVRYDVDPQDADGMIAGGRMTLHPGDRIAIGATAVREEKIAGTDATGTLAGVDLSARLTDQIGLEASAAVSEQDASDTLPEGASGHAGEFALAARSDRMTGVLSLRRETTDFGIDNTDATGNTVVTVGADLDIALDSPARTETAADDAPASPAESEPARARHRLVVEATREETLETGRTSRVVDVRARREAGRIEGALGLRSEDTRTPDGTHSSALKVVGEGTVRSPDARLALSFGQEATIAQDGDDVAADRSLLEVSWAATEHLEIIATTELAFDDGVSEGVDARLTTLGGRLDLWDGASLATGAVVAAGTGAPSQVVGHVGLDQEIVLTDATTLTFAAEHQRQVAGPATPPSLEAGLSNPRLSEDHVVAALGIAHTTESWQGRGSLEWRLADSERHVGLQGRATRPFDDTLAGGLKLTASRSTPRTQEGSDSAEAELAGSLAWRPLDRTHAVVGTLKGAHTVETDRHETRLVGSVFSSQRLDNDHRLNLRGGVKHSRFVFDDTAYTDVLGFAGAEYRHRLTETLDIGVHGSRLHSFDTGVGRHHLGASIGITPFEQGWVSVGYNARGYDDPDFSRGGETRQGAFVQFRFKLDQGTLQDLAGR